MSRGDRGMGGLPSSPTPGGLEVMGGQNGGPAQESLYPGTTSPHVVLHNGGFHAFFENLQRHP